MWVFTVIHDEIRIHSTVLAPFVPYLPLPASNNVIALLQRVGHAYVSVNDTKLAEIGVGLMVLSCVEPADTSASAKRMAERICGYRIFGDANGKMNRNVQDHGGSVLLIPQFTLAADTSKGMRPSFTRAAPPELGKSLFDELATHINDIGVPLGLGQFGADMQVSLTNDGPVTFWLQV